ncbi:MAG: cytochrome c biogenesis protein CcdA, partial [Phototrophicaceae bacterium]
ISAAVQIIGRVGGLVIIFFGLHFMGALSWAFNRIRQHQTALGRYATPLVFVTVSPLIFWAFNRQPSAFAENVNFFDYTLISLPVFTAFAMWLILGGALTAPRDFWLHTLNQIEGALYADTRQQLNASGRSGFGSSLLMGVVFAAGWTPCIGPIYGAILTLAANGGSISDAAVLLSAYSLGLGVPFIVTALLLDSAQGGLRRLNRHMGTIKLISGLFLVAIGLLVMTGQLQRFSARGATGALGEFSFNLEECFTEAVAGNVAWGAVWNCVNATDDALAPIAPIEALPDGAAVGSIAPIAVTPSASTVNGFEGISAADSPVNSNVGIEVGQTAPDFSAFTHTGEEIRLSDLRGKVVLLNFWATWCGPCRVEMPDLEDAALRYGDQLVILGINNRETATQISDFADEIGVTFPLLLDLQGNLQDGFAIRSYPTTLLLDAQGIIVDKHLGFLSAEQLAEKLAALF